MSRLPAGGIVFDLIADDKASNVLDKYSRAAERAGRSASRAADKINQDLNRAMERNRREVEKANAQYRARFGQRALGAASPLFGISQAAGFTGLNIGFAALAGPEFVPFAAAATAIGVTARAIGRFGKAALDAAEEAEMLATTYTSAQKELQAVMAEIGAAISVDLGEAISAFAQSLDNVQRPLGEFFTGLTAIAEFMAIMGFNTTASSRSSPGLGGRLLRENAGSLTFGGAGGAFDAARQLGGAFQLNVESAKLQAENAAADATAKKEAEREAKRAEREKERRDKARDKEQEALTQRILKTMRDAEKATREYGKAVEAAKLERLSKLYDKLAKSIEDADKRLESLVSEAFPEMAFESRLDGILTAVASGRLPLAGATRLLALDAAGLGPEDRGFRSGSASGADFFQRRFSAALSREPEEPELLKEIREEIKDAKRKAVLGAAEELGVSKEIRDILRERGFAGFAP